MREFFFRLSHATEGCDAQRQITSTLDMCLSFCVCMCTYVYTTHVDPFVIAIFIDSAMKGR